MSDVIKFPTSDATRIWVCDCGCSTFELLSTGDTQCASCGEVSSNEGGWFTPDSDNEWNGETPVRDVKANGCVDFSRRKLVQYAQSSDACTILVVDADGSVHLWTEVSTPEQLEWLRRKFDQAHDIAARETKGEK